MNKIYTIQSFIDESTVEEKRANKDYDVFVKDFLDDEKIITIVVDGCHSLEAAKRDGIEPNIIKQENDWKYSLEEYIKAFNDLSNPIEIHTGEELW